MVLEPYGHEGSDEHLLPLAAEFVDAMHIKDKRIEAVLPKGEV